MHSVCPQIRPAAFNRFGCDFLFSLAWQTAQTAPLVPVTTTATLHPNPSCAIRFFFSILAFTFSSLCFRAGRTKKKRKGGRGKKEGSQRAMLGGKKVRARFNLCHLRLAMIGRQLCASRTKCCLRTLAHRWLVTSVADTSERSLQKKKEKKSPKTKLKKQA